MYEALRTICACYLRSDREGIIDTLHAYRAADALYNIAKAEVALLHPHMAHEACKHADGAPFPVLTYEHVKPVKFDELTEPVANP